eukprot:PLAT10740.1.p1 GENE.PLAT10740.1~~PLAT10740.1.p1  ORF type:complete len:394 (+),score=163.45 PLAT10740.1:34-1215(+)
MTRLVLPCLLALAAAAAAAPLAMPSPPLHDDELTTSGTGDAKLVLLTAQQAAAGQARCLDGSPRGYYTRLVPGETRWMIYLQGGGACSHQSTCQARSKTALGSSKYWNSTMTMIRMQNGSTTANPKFARWNQVFIPYCTGDVHGGRVAASSATWNFFFEGHTGLVTLLQHMEDTLGLAHVSELVVTGGSAGGWGTFLNIDYIASRYPHARVTGVPVAGWFLDAHPYSNKTTPFSTGVQAIVQLYDLFLNPSCVAAHRPSLAFRCAIAQYAYPYIRTPLFIVESQYDAYQLFVLQGVPFGYNNATCAYDAYFSDAMRTSLLHQLRKTDGLFLPSCFLHDQGPFDTHIDGLNYNASLVQWYDGQRVGEPLVDYCQHSFACNPTCRTAGTFACPLS